MPVWSFAMISEETKSKYLPTIGIECHVQLNTKTKLFVGVDNNARDRKPNETISEICLGLPGVLPILNRHAVELAIKAGLALNAEINSTISFDRKHYFYPDLPKGYQITQMYQPIILGGFVELPNTKTKIRIHHAHLEEDAGKNTHPSGADYSLVDLNRAGTPLLEIVSEPDIHSAEEAKEYVHELYLLMKYSKVSDVDLFQGNMRFDVNVSVALKGSDQLGTRTETKNLNSFKSVERAAKYEIDRQIELLEKQQQITQETRGWDDSKQKSFSQRGKEFAHDYRYMPEPDIPPVVISKEDVGAAKAQLPILPGQLREKFSDCGLKDKQIETVLNSDYSVAILLSLLDKVDNAAITRIANWLIVDLPPILQAKDHQDNKLSAGDLMELNSMVEAGNLSSTNAKEVLSELVMSENSAQQIAKDKNLLQLSNDSEIESIVDEVIAANPQPVQQYQAGEEKVIGFLVGQVMKASKGQANPGMVNKILKSRLS
jgi:aspartyl-tRNA(Asn)/glutamyl-tRNA(Gln) amidotransferase subunit B